MHVAVVVDDLDPNRRRRCFWEYQLDQRVENVQHELVCLPALAATQQDFDIGRFDIIILNWDVINGDNQFQASESRLRLEFYLPRLERFVREGGVVIVENQSRWWAPIQDCYDTLFNGELKVLARTHAGYGWASEARRSNTLAQHPVVRGLPSQVESAYADLPASETQASWFPPGSVGEEILRNAHYAKLYSGSFRAWTHNWLPLIYTSDGKHPILLAKSDGAGLWVASTMFIASSNVRALIKNLIVGTERDSYETRKYHEHHERRAILTRITASALILVGIPALVYVALASHIIEVRIPFADTLIGSLVLSGIFVLLTAILAPALSFVVSNFRLAIRVFARKSSRLPRR